MGVTKLNRYHSTLSLVKSRKLSGVAYLVIIVFLQILFGYIVPTIHYSDVPYSPDSFGHYFYTKIMANTFSLTSFYDYCIKNNYLGYDYPFALWMVGSVADKLIGLNSTELLLLTPFCFFLIILVLVFVLSITFVGDIKSVKKSSVGLMSLLFLLSIPGLATDFLGYISRIMALPLLISIYHVLFDKNVDYVRFSVLTSLLVFVLILTHTGTYLFLYYFVIVYLLIFSLMSGKLHTKSLGLMALMNILLVVTLDFFKYVHPQYVDKGRLILSVGDMFPWPFSVVFNSMGNMYYQNIIVEKDLIFTVLWISFIFLISKLLTYLHRYIFAIKSNDYILNASVPLIGGIKNISHTVFFWPVWIGFHNIFYSIVGLSKLKKEVLYVLISVIIVTVPSGMVAGERATRELFYFYPIIPIVSSVGVYRLLESAYEASNKIKKKFISILIVATICVQIVIPVLGNIYYHPLISGTKYERAGMHWLSGVGDPGEGVAGSAGMRPALYSDKIPIAEVSLPHGSESRRFSINLYKSLFEYNSEDYTKDLSSSYNVKYIIFTEKMFRIFGKNVWDLKADSNSVIDKIYSSKNLFSIFLLSTPMLEIEPSSPPLDFINESVMIKDAGASYLIDTKSYRVKISKNSPKIQYIGSKTSNYFGDGGISEFIRVHTIFGNFSGTFVIDELDYKSVLLKQKEILYFSTLKDGDKNIGTIIVKFTFYEKAFKKEVIFLNDWINAQRVEVTFTTSIISPSRFFEVYNYDGIIRRTIYPSEDSVTLKGLRYDGVFLAVKESEGIFIRYSSTSPYPDELSYRGLVNYNYSRVNVKCGKWLVSGESFHVTQWYSVGNQTKAKENVDMYQRVTLYPYPNGIRPLLLVFVQDPASIAGILQRFNMSYSIVVDPLLVNFSDNTSLQYMDLNSSQVEYLLEYEGGTKLNGYVGFPFYGAFSHDYLNLSQIAALEHMGIQYVFFKKIPMPFRNLLYEEGWRSIQPLYHHGSRLNISLIPISVPEISFSEIQNAEFVLLSASERDELLAFVVDLEHFNESYYVQLEHFFNLAKMRGYTFVTPYDLIRHYLLLENIRLRTDLNKGKVFVLNDNSVPVEGVTIKIKSRDSDLNIVGGKVYRKDCRIDACYYYIGVDLSPRSTAVLSFS